MKHGPIALIHEGFPCVVLCPQDSMFEKNWSNIQELRARGAHIIAITTGQRIESIDSQIVVPQTHEVLQPILLDHPAPTPRLRGRGGARFGSSGADLEESRQDAPGPKRGGR